MQSTGFLVYDRIHYSPNKRKDKKNELHLFQEEEKTTTMKFCDACNNLIIFQFSEEDGPILSCRICKAEPADGKGFCLRRKVTHHHTSATPCLSKDKTALYDPCLKQTHRVTCPNASCLSNTNSEAVGTWVNGTLVYSKNMVMSFNAEGQCTYVCRVCETECKMI